MSTPAELVAAIAVHNAAIPLVRNVKAHRLDAKNPIRLEPAGGKIEAGETEEEAVLREVREELRRTCTIIRKLYSALTHSNEGDFLVHMYVVQMHGDMDSLTTHEPAKLDGVVWATKHDLETWRQTPPKDCVLVPNIAEHTSKLKELFS